MSLQHYHLVHSILTLFTLPFFFIEIIKHQVYVLMIIHEPHSRLKLVKHVEI